MLGHKRARLIHRWIAASVRRETPGSSGAVSRWGHATLVVSLFVAAAILLPLSASAFVSTGPTTSKNWFWNNPLPQGNDLRAQSWIDANHGWIVGVSGTTLMTVDGGHSWVEQDAVGEGIRDLTGVSFINATTGWAVGVSASVQHTTDGGATWVAQTANTVPAARNFRSVSFFNANVGVAVGDAGATTSTIQYTSDGGAHWRAATTACTASLTNVDMVSATTGWAVGAGGALVKTSDGGATWIVQQQLTTAGLTGVSFEPSGLVGYVVGNVNGVAWTVYKTADGGATWSLSAPPSGGSSLSGVSCLDANNAVIVGGGGLIRRTSDGGATWVDQTQHSIGSLFLRGVQMVDANNVKAIGDVGLFFSTSDGGNSWFSLMRGTTQLLRATWFPDANHGWAVGDNGTVMNTVDAGTTWLTQQVAQGSWRAVHFVDNKNGWAVGDNGAIIRTSDGSTWVTQNSGTTQQLSGVWFLNFTTGYVVGGAGTILKTIDGGVTWVAKTAAGGPGTIDAVWFADANTGYFVNSSSFIYKTIDGGDTWTRTASGAGQILNAIWGVDANTLWAAGNGGTVVKSTNGGSTWTAQASGAGSQPIRTIVFTDANHGWFGSTYGLVRTTTDGGTTWTTETAGMPTDSVSGVYGMSFVDGNNGYLVGDTGVIRRTFDGGANWASLQYGTWATFNQVVFPDVQNGFACGAGGLMMHTSDGGQSWAQQRTNGGSNLRRMWMQDAQHGWAVGENGVIRNTVDGGATWSPQSSGTTNVLWGVSSVTTQSAMVVGDAGTILRTANGGSTWTAATSVPTSQSINAVTMVSSTTAFAAATYATGSPNVIKTTNGGATWTAVTVPPATSNLYSVTFLPSPNQLVGFITGDSGIILKTVDGGATWARQTTPVTAQIRSVSFTGLNTGLAVGFAGTVLGTANGGSTWTLQTPGTALSLGSIAYSDSSQAWIVGGNGLMLRSGDLTPPKTTLTLSPPSPNGANGWYSTAPSIALASNKLGVSYFGWTSAAGPFTPYIAPFLVTEGSKTLYYYSVDTSSNAETINSTPIKADYTAPSPVTNVTETVVATSTAQIRWTAGSDALSGVDHYNVLLDGSFKMSATATSAVLSGLSSATTYTVSVTTVDGAGNASAPSGSATFRTNTIVTTPFTTIIGVIPPSPNGSNGWYVTTPTVTLAALPMGQPCTTLYSWVSPAGPYGSYDSTLTPPAGLSALYYSTHDPYGFRTDEATLGAGFKLDSETPSTPELSAFATTYQSASLSWPAVADPPSGIDHYAILVDGALAGSTAGAPYVVMGLAPSSTHAFRIAAVSSAGATSALSAEVLATTPAAPLPAAPSTVLAVAPSGDFTFVDWAASSDVVGAARYSVWRSDNGVSYSRVATAVADTSYVDSGLRSSTRYWYAVSTVDSRGESSLSDTATSVWPHIAPFTGRPERPSGLAIVAGSNSVLLTWAISSNPAVTGYVVRRTPSSLSSSVTTIPVSSPTFPPSLTDATAANGQVYYYSVCAVDASGAVGYPSAEIVASPREVYSGADTHLIDYVNGSSKVCYTCHSAHGSPQVGPTGPRLGYPVAGPNEDSMCLSCHSLGSGRASTDTQSQITDPLKVSGHSVWSTATPNATMTCDSCHRPIGDAASSTPAALLGKNTVGAVQTGDALCYTCHGQGTTLASGDMTGFEDSAHANVGSPSSGSGVKCSACHQPHASRNTGLTTYEGFMVCMQCHTAANTNPNQPDIWSQLSLNDDPEAKHPILPQSQSTGAAMSCQNCHNTHAAGAAYPLVDPHNPGPTGRWTTTPGDNKAFCFTCHNGRPLPTNTETQPWAEAVKGQDATTTVPDIKDAYNTNVHGFGAKSGLTTTTAFLRPDMGYSADAVLDCSACHESHGSVNDFALKQDVSSVDGKATENGLIVYEIPAGSITATSPVGHDLRFFCSSCHLFDPATHDPMAGTDTTQIGKTDCTRCHRHIRANGTPSHNL